MDSMPVEVIDRWRSERHQWLRSHGINPRSNDWRQQLERLNSEARQEFYGHFSTRWHAELDAGYGDCVFSQPSCAQVVSESFLKFDEVRYELTDFAIMPNHVHLLAAFRDEKDMLAQCEGWKHFQAAQINRITGSTGRFWQQDGFDHLVRSEEQFEHFRRYIAENPRRAGLSSGQATIWSKYLG